MAREAEHLRGAPSVSYTPNVPGAITHLSAPAVAMLKQLSGVATIEVLVTCEAPTHRIIHLRDWHLVPRDEFLPPVEAALGRAVFDKAGDLCVAELELQVELVRAEQLVVLRSLVQHHGLRQALSENITAQGLADFRNHLDDLRDLDRSVRNMLKTREGLKRLDADIDRQTAVAGHRLRLREIGAAARLAVEGLVEVLPLEDDRHAETGCTAKTRDSDYVAKTGTLTFAPGRNDENDHDRRERRQQEGVRRDVLRRPVRPQQQFAVHQEPRHRHDPER